VPSFVVVITFDHPICLLLPIPCHTLKTLCKVVGEDNESEEEKLQISTISVFDCLLYALLLSPTKAELPLPVYTCGKRMHFEDHWYLQRVSMISTVIIEPFIFVSILTTFEASFIF
jgi:hypothetical protein